MSSNRFRREHFARAVGNTAVPEIDYQPFGAVCFSCVNIPACANFDNRPNLKELPLVLPVFV